MFLTRKAEFSASHVCANPDWSTERNCAVYGTNANPNGHGHNYVLEVTLTGDPDPVTGMVFDLRELKEILNRQVVDPMDHRFLNKEVPPFDRVIPTTENLAVEIWKRIEPQIRGVGVGRGVRLHNVRLYETADLYVDYGGGHSGDER
jgi:6-pyruvoyltetrahydropterin/6-carboxytetrahydropterin synthase